MIALTKDLIQRYNKPGPRYTSYPTAPEWQVSFSETTYHQALAQFDRTDKTASLYVHIPFCTSMCYYCGCNVTIRKSREETGDDYLDYLEKELGMIATSFSKKPRLKQVHLGGGTPNFLSEPQLTRLYHLIINFFDIDSDAEVAIEVDPRSVTTSQLKTLRHLGFNRISMGIQDFDPEVQKAVNRIQPFEMVQPLTEEVKRLGFHSLNYDLIYGLPHQTLENFKDTIDKVLTLSPDRIALYSFAHIPWLKSHQKLIEESVLPDSNAKLDIFIAARDQLLQNGYKAIAMDHFAKSEDDLAKAFESNTLHRNFMGYTVKPADEYIGIGVSSIGFLENTFIQNNHEIKKYYETLDAGHLPVSKGLVLSEDDKIRQWTISKLMCQFKLEKAIFNALFNQDFDTYFTEEKAHLAQCEVEGLLTQTPSHIEATELGRFFIRNICMGFDWYLRQDRHKRFSKTV